MAEMLSNDGVDRFNYKWMMLFLLLLSFFSFIIPLHQAFRGSMASSLQTKGEQTLGNNTPNVKAICWCPSEFTPNYVHYANVFCASQFNSMIRGEKSVSLYDIWDHRMPMSVERHLANAAETRKESIQRIRQDDMPERKLKNLKACVQKLVTYQTPILLLVFGILLALPQAVWLCLSDVLPSFNLGQTLQDLQQASNFSKDAFQDLSGVIASMRPSRSHSILYLFKKTLSVLVVMALLIVLTQHAMPRVEQLDHDISANHASRSTDNRTTATYLYEDFLCDFKIHQLQSIQVWTVQCKITNVDELVRDDTPHAEEWEVALSMERSLLELESTMYNIALGVLVLLLVANIASLIAWLVKLEFDWCLSLGLAKNVSWDVKLLVHMARINTSAAVSQMLARDHGHKAGFDQIDMIQMNG